MNFLVSKGLILAALVTGALSTACTEAAVCNGVELDDGTCEALCDADSCGDGAICLSNRCADACGTNEECADTHYCARVQVGDEVSRHCVTLDLGDGFSTGKYEACTGDDQCDSGRGFTCVDETCVVAGCTTDVDCGDIGPCAFATDGSRFCEQVEDYQASRVGSLCPSGSMERAEALAVGGACAAPLSDLEACNTEKECTADAPGTACHPACSIQSRSLQACLRQYSPCDDTLGEFCLGRGEGDADAYCSRPCTDDGTACGTGYACSLLSAGQAPCDTSCGATSASTESDCIPGEEIGDGKAYQCGHRGRVYRSVCVKNEYCGECETDADCTAVTGQVCAKDPSGANICTFLCDPAKPTCPIDQASECAVHDTDLGVATCAHRFGECSASDGAPCEPCRTDQDCGGNALCIQFVSGESMCIDLEFECACDPETDPADSIGVCNGGCPSTPAGHSMACLTGPNFQGSLENRCIGAQVESTPNGPSFTVSCWEKKPY